MDVGTYTHILQLSDITLVRRGRMLVADYRRRDPDMLTILLVWAAALGQEDGLLRVFMYPGIWAEALSQLEGRNVERRDIAGVGCVGMVSTDMYCSWQRRTQNEWHKYSGQADLSGNMPRLKDATPDKPNVR